MGQLGCRREERKYCLWEIDGPVNILFVLTTYHFFRVIHNTVNLLTAAPLKTETYSFIFE